MGPKIIKLYSQITMRKTFTQKFDEEQRVEEEVSKAWGYATSPSNLKHSVVNERGDKQVSINKYLKPLKIDDSKPIISSQHQELIKEIAQIEHQKKMRKKAEQRNEAEFNFTKLLNQRVRQYNYLIDHKHIKQKNSQATKRVLKLKPKSEAELIVEQIKLKNKELIGVEDIQKQFELNKKINGLYRKYKEKMYDQRQKNNEDRQHQTINSSRVNRARTKSIASEQKIKIYNQSISKVKIKREGDNYTNFESKESQKVILNLKEPYINEEDIKKNNEFKRSAENRKEILEMYKFKITKLKNLNQNNSDISQQGDSKVLNKKKTMSMTKESLKKLDNSFDQEKDIMPEGKVSSVINDLKEKRQNQLRYFTTFLEKRNRRFKKPWGNKILIKYDSKSQARQMLQGTSDSISPNKTLYFSTAHNSSLDKSKKSTSVRAIPKNISDQDRMIYESLQKEKNDPDLYQTMCKNEKVNLFLKAKKRNKE